MKGLVVLLILFMFMFLDVKLMFIYIGVFFMVDICKVMDGFVVVL